MWFERFNIQTLVLFSSSSGHGCGGTENDHRCWFGDGFDTIESNVSADSGIELDDELVDVAEVDARKFRKAE